MRVRNLSGCRSSRRQGGFALLSTLLLLVVLSLLLAAYFVTTGIELGAVRSSASGVSGFYAAEAGLNLRGEAIRQRFVDFARPEGTSPDPAAPCKSGSPGSGDFARQTFEIGGRTVTTYVREDPRNQDPNDAERLVDIRPDELYGGLKAFQHRYTVFSEAVPKGGDAPEAILEMVFRSRQVPLFQFAAFYNKDLEILPGPPMLLNGRIHVNGDLYLNAGSTLDITGQITVAKRRPGSGANEGGNLYRRRKNDGSCGGTVRVDDGLASAGPKPAIACSGLIPQSRLDAWRGRVETGLDTLAVPDEGTFAARPGAFYWDRADLRLALVLDGAGNPSRVEVRRADGSLDGPATSALGLCRYSAEAQAADDFSRRHPAVSRVVDASASFYNYRENRTRNRSDRTRLLEVDVQGLLDCIHDRRAVGDLGRLDESRHGGLVWHFTVDGPLSGLCGAQPCANPYGVRLRNAERLASSHPGAPAVRGLTVVSDQALYVQGHFNRLDKKPASLLGDSLNLLSQAWDYGRESSATRDNLYKPEAEATTVQAAFLAGTDTTGSEGRFGGGYNGGLENYPRFHENWRGKLLTYRGSFVSLNRPAHAVGSWSNQVYDAPDRDRAFDTDFSDPAGLPPLSLSFVYLRQELFVRDFDR